jgi:hypothetical protein
MLPCKFYHIAYVPEKNQSDEGCISEKEIILAYRRSEGTESTFFYANVEVLKVFSETIFGHNR